MRIALVSTVYKATPPKGYGGIERVVHLLAEELSRTGHEVVLFGVPGSACSGTTVTVTGYDASKAPSGVRRESHRVSEEPLCAAMDEHFRHHNVDVIHDWSFENLFVLRSPKRFPFIVSTCIPQPAGYKRPNLVAASRAHALFLGKETPYVHYGLDLQDRPWSEKKSESFIHISKVTPSKGQHLAILAARRAKKELRLAGNIEDRLYYYGAIKPLMFFYPRARYIGEIAGTQDHLLSAAALVQTPRWFEVFPLVVLEALACGTPVIALDRGGVSEQIVQGETGFVCRDVKDLSDAMTQVSRIQPSRCRAYAEEHFSVRVMAQNYVRLYQKVIDGKNW